MTRTKLIALALIFGTSILHLTAQDITEARQLLDNERYGSAETILERASATDQTDPEVNYLLVKTYLGQDKVQEAKEYVDSHLQIAKTGEADPMNRVAYARFLLSTGNYVAASEIFSALAENKKNLKNPGLLMAMAEANIDEETGDARSAINWLELAGKRNKSNADIDMLLGKAYRKAGDASNAFLSYQQAIKKDKESARAHYLMGKIFTAQKNPEIYMDHFLKAYEIDSTYAPVLEELYNHYYYTDLAQSRKFLEKFIANSDYSLQNDLNMTDMLFLSGEFKNAIDAANVILQKDPENSQPRLHKLIAYSYARSGDSINAIRFINKYFAKEDPKKLIAADFQLKGELTKNIIGAEKEAAGYYAIAAEMDSLVVNKTAYATEIAGLYKRINDFSGQAMWLGKLYQWNENANNVDLFNWGVAHYNAQEYPLTDSVFNIYTAKFPESIYGYYWRAQANAAIDTSMTLGLAIPFYTRLVELGELDIPANTKMLLKAYGYLAGYEANITKNYEASLAWFEKYQVLDPENADVIRYVETLKKWIGQKN